MGWSDIFSGFRSNASPGGPISNASGSQYVAGAIRGGTVNVTKDFGGYYNEYVAANDRILRSGATVNVSGKCYSGCTLALASPNLHVAPGAVFGFHGAYDSVTGQQAPGATQDLLNRLPANVRALIKSQGKPIPDGRYGGDHLKITGAQLIAIGYPRIGETRDGRGQEAAPRAQVAASAVPAAPAAAAPVAQAPAAIAAAPAPAPIRAAPVAPAPAAIAAAPAARAATPARTSAPAADPPPVIYADKSRKPAPRSARPVSTPASDFGRSFADGWNSFWANVSNFFASLRARFS